MTLTHQHFEQAAKTLDVETAAIKAVAEVESSGSGFLSTGEPVILFEPHQFWRELKKRGIAPEQVQTASNKDILYPKWGTLPYGKSSEQHGRLSKAAAINREAALCSASWGKFQIMGYHFKACGCDTLQQFVNAMYKDEGEHLRLFCNFLKSQKLDGFLKNKEWERFAFRYNGAGYAKNNYHKKLHSAYLKHKK
jgi:hypothetical protein